MHRRSDCANEKNAIFLEKEQKIHRHYRFHSEMSVERRVTIDDLIQSGARTTIIHILLYAIHLYVIRASLFNEYKNKWQSIEKHTTTNRRKNEHVINSDARIYSNWCVWGHTKTKVGEIQAVQMFSVLK